MAFLSFPYGWPWGLAQDAPSPPPESVRMDERSLTRSYADVITKFSRLDGLPILLTHGASLARFARWSSAITEFLDRHAALRRTKVTRPPAPCLNDLDICCLQEQCWRNRLEIHSRPHSEHAWKAIWGAKNKLKKEINKEKRTLLLNALLSKRRKKVWKTINRTLHPSEKPVFTDPDE